MPMPEHLQRAREKSMAAEKAKDEAKVQLVGLRKTDKGFEVVSFEAPTGAVAVINAAEPLEYASHALLKMVRRMVETA